MTASCQHIIAIFPEMALAQVEKRLVELNVPDLFVTRVKGYGEYRNYYSKDLMDSAARLDIFAPESRAAEIAQAIAEAAHAGLPSDGLVAIAPLGNVFRIRDMAQLEAEG